MNKVAFLVVLLGVLGYVEADCANGATQSLSNSSICYSFVVNASEFIEAEISCQSSGGHLASISDGFTNVLLAQLAKKKLNGATDFWIGGQDLGTKDHWIWVDGANFTFTNWAPEEPVELPGFDCLGLTVQEGYWYTYDCFKLKPFVCEIPPNAPLPTAGTQPPSTIVAQTTTTQNVITTLSLSTVPSTQPPPTTTIPDVVISTTDFPTSSFPNFETTTNSSSTTGSSYCPSGSVNTGPCIDTECPQSYLCLNGQCCCFNNLTNQQQTSTTSSDDDVNSM